MNKYYSVFLLFVTCAMAMLLGSSQLCAQQPAPETAIVHANTTLVARVAPEALDVLLFRKSESKEGIGETSMGRRLRQTKELLGGHPVWVTVDWPSTPTKVSIYVNDPEEKKVNQLLKLWRVNERTAYGRGIYSVSVRAIGDVDLLHAEFEDDRWKTKFSEAFSNPKSPVTVAMLPPRYLSRTCKELSIKLPDYLGGGPVTVLTEGALSASVTLDPSTGLIDGSIESRDRETADNLKTFLDGARKIALQHLAKTTDDPWARVLAMVAMETEFSVAQNHVLFRFEHEGKEGSANPIQQALQAVTGPVAQAIHSERLRNAVIGMLNYESAHQHFPPQGESTKSDEGNGLSWRVHILPFLGKEGFALWKKFKIGQPWDSPHNFRLLDQIPDIYRTSDSELAESADDKRGLTAIVAPISEKTILGSAKLTTYADIVDGTSNTILLVVVKDDLAVPWTAPQDYKFDPDDPSSGLKMYGDKTPVGMGDGSALSADKENDWLNLFQMNDREVVNLK